MYFFAMMGIAVMSVTSVLACRGRNIDIFSVTILAFVAALGGGTMRDVILDRAVFWTTDVNYVWAVITSAVCAFCAIGLLAHRYVTLLYLDAIALALFAIVACEMTVTKGYPAIIAIIMGVITAVFGGIIRDVLTASPTLLLQRELYATPVLLGTTLYVACRYFFPEWAYSEMVGMLFIFVVRAWAIRYRIAFPAYLCLRS